LIASWLDAQRAYNQVPGISAAIVHDQELLWRGATGYADAGGGQKAQAATT